MTYANRQESLRAEALRTVPGVMAAKDRGDLPGAVKLIEDFHLSAVRLGITVVEAWSILFGSALHWAMEISDALANNQHVTTEDLFQSLGRSAAVWVSEVRGVGGY